MIRAGLQVQKVELDRADSREELRNAFSKFLNVIRGKFQAAQPVEFPISAIANAT